MRVLVFLAWVSLSLLLLVQSPLAGENGARGVRSFVSPPYPVIARRAGVFGDVEARLSVSPSGEVVKVEILEGHGLLRDYVQEALREWIFCSSEESVTLDIRVSFTLVEPRTNDAVTTVVKADLPTRIEIISNLPEKVGPDVLPKSE